MQGVHCACCLRRVSRLCLPGRQDGAQGTPTFSELCLPPRLSKANRTAAQLQFSIRCMSAAAAVVSNAGRPPVSGRCFSSPSRCGIYCCRCEPIGSHESLSRLGFAVSCEFHRCNSTSRHGPAATDVFRSASSSVVLPWSTWPIKHTTGTASPRSCCTVHLACLPLHTRAKSPRTRNPPSCAVQCAIADRADMRTDWNIECVCQPTLAAEGHRATGGPSRALVAASLSIESTRCDSVLDAMPSHPYTTCSEHTLHARQAPAAAQASCAALRKATPIAYGFGSDSADSVRLRPTAVGASLHF